MAAPFSNMIDSITGRVNPTFKEELTLLRSFLISKGYDVFLAHEREGWGRALLSPKECTKLDFNEISACDVIIAIPGDPPSGGTHVELGWASAMGKPIILLLEEDGKYSPLVLGLAQISKVIPIHFRGSIKSTLNCLYDALLELAGEDRHNEGLSEDFHSESVSFSNDVHCQERRATMARRVCLEDARDRLIKRLRGCEQEENLNLKQHLECILEQVERALKKLEEGTYGVCDVCGENISWASLEALPYKIICIKCDTYEQAYKES
jgi:RNA polymerase-binding transcription factor DksA